MSTRTLTKDQMLSLAEHIENAELNVHDITKVTNDFPDMTFGDAYDIQWEIRRRKEARGNKVIGMKMGLTSWAKMAQMGVETPVYGFLADYFSVPDGGDIDTSRLIHPKIEAEVAFVTKAPLKGPGCHIGDVLAATDFIIPQFALGISVMITLTLSFGASIEREIASVTSLISFARCSLVRPSRISRCAIGITLS